MSIAPVPLCRSISSCMFTCLLKAPGSENPSVFAFTTLCFHFGSPVCVLFLFLLSNFTWEWFSNRFSQVVYSLFLCGTFLFINLCLYILIPLLVRHAIWHVVCFTICPSCYSLSVVIIKTRYRRCSTPRMKKWCYDDAAFTHLKYLHKLCNL